MALVWKTVVVPIGDEEELETGFWEPFAVVEDEDVGPCVVCKKLVEDEGERSSTRAGNENTAGNEPDRGD